MSSSAPADSNITIEKNCCHVKLVDTAKSSAVIIIFRARVPVRMPIMQFRQKQPSFLTCICAGLKDIIAAWLPSIPFWKQRVSSWKPEVLFWTPLVQPIYKWRRFGNSKYHWGEGQEAPAWVLSVPPNHHRYRIQNSKYLHRYQKFR